MLLPSSPRAEPWPARTTAHAARPALLLLAGWLLLTALPLAAAGPAAGSAPLRHFLLFAATLLALGVAWRSTLASEPGSTADDPRTSRAERWRAEGWATLLGWLPLFAVPALYAELPHIAFGLARIGGRQAAVPGSGFAAMHDGVVIGWEHALFGPLLGASPAVALATRAPWTLLSEVLHLAYLSYYVIIYIPPALCWWDARRRGLGRPLSGARAPAAAFFASAATVLLAFVLCYAVFVTFPVQGPWYTWQTGGPQGLPLHGPVRAFVQSLLVAGSSRGTAFPSSHVAVSVAQSVALARVAPRLAAIVGPLTVLLALGAVYGGYHYGVDALVGAIVGALTGWAGPRLVEASLPS